VFGDSTVMMLLTPRHTPGHQVLLVKLQTSGNVLLSGDLAHFRENYDHNVVPGFNSNRAETLASIDRSSRSRRTSRQPSLYNTIRATLINCQGFLHPRNSQK
jgi:glyoxylase-like metal-dependent hydrolase (beta-lactamase superfamily II)